MTKSSADRDYIQSLERGRSVIRAFGPESRSMTLSEVAVATGLTRATARRFLITLERLGYMSSNDKRFTLTPKTLDLGYSYLSSLSVWERMLPYLHEVTLAVGESSSAAVLDRGEVVYVARSPVIQRIMSVNIQVGTRFPAYATSMGQVLLAYLPDHAQEAYIESTELERFTDQTLCDKEQLKERLTQVATQGYSLNNEELELGLLSIAVPIRNSEDDVIAAVNVSAPARRVTIEEMLETFLPALEDAAQKMSGTGRHLAL